MRAFVRPGDTEAQSAFNDYKDRGVAQSVGIVLLAILGFIGLFVALPANRAFGWFMIILGILISSTCLGVAYYHVRAYRKLVSTKRILEVDDTTANLIEAINTIINDEAQQQLLHAFDALQSAQGEPGQAGSNQPAMAAEARRILSRLSADTNTQ